MKEPTIVWIVDAALTTIFLALLLFVGALGGCDVDYDGQVEHSGSLDLNAPPLDVNVAYAPDTTCATLVPFTSEATGEELVPTATVVHIAYDRYYRPWIADDGSGQIIGDRFRILRDGLTFDVAYLREQLDCDNAP